MVGGSRRHTAKAGRGRRATHVRRHDLLHGPDDVLGIAAKPASSVSNRPLLPPLLDPSLVVEPGGQRYFEQGRPLLSVSWP